MAEFMEGYQGQRRGSYIWGRQVNYTDFLQLQISHVSVLRSVHNVRIERLWVDVTSTFGAKWAQFFTHLELHCGFDIHNTNHIWLVHYLFLTDINNDSLMFVHTWNLHRIQSRRGQPSRSPVDMFGFDQLTNGIRGDTLSEEDLEVYGVDWEALGSNEVSSSNLANNPITEGVSSWVGRVGPPEHLSSVTVEVPETDFVADVVDGLFAHVSALLEFSDTESLAQRWIMGLSYIHSREPNF